MTKVYFHPGEPIIAVHNLRTAGNQNIHGHIFNARNMPDGPGHRMLTVLGDPSELILSHVIQDIVLKGVGFTTGRFIL